MIDINGFLTSTEFLIQLATAISAILSALVAPFLLAFFGTAA